MKIINELNELKRMNKLTSTEQGIVNYILTYPEELEKILLSATSRINLYLSRNRRAYLPKTWV